MATEQLLLPLTRRTFLGGSLAAGAALLLAGCGFQQEQRGPEGSTALTLVQSTGSIDTLDPHYVNNSMLILTAALLEGLVFQNDDATDVVPAAAESWTVSDDGLAYTFTMREGAVWSNGDPVTASDAEWTFQRLLAPTGAGSNAAAGASSYQLGLGIAGASAYLSGASDDWSSVGIAATDDRTLTIELDAPNPDFLIGLTHYSMVLLHPASVEADPQGWQQPENWVGNGAYTLEGWVPNSSIALSANPTYWDADAVAVGSITMRLGGDGPTNLLAFKSGDLDIVTVSSGVRNDEGITDQIRQVDGYGTFYLQRMWGGHPALEDQRVRRALSMSIDREAMAAVAGFAKAGTSIVPDVVPGWSDELAIPYDVDAARKLLDEAGFGDGLPPARVQYNFETPWFEALREHWADTLGLTLQIEILESGVHSESRWQPYADEGVMSFYAGTFSGLPTMNNWVYNLFGYDYVRQFSLSAQDRELYESTQADDSLSGPERADAVEQILATKSTPEAQEFARLAREASQSTDENARLKTFLRAAAIRDEMAFTIPVIWNSLAWAVSPDVSGMAARPSPEGYYYKYLAAAG